MLTKKLNSAKAGTRTHADLKSLDGKSGVYVLRKGDQIYIGSTRDLRARLRQHSYRFPGWRYRYEELPLRAAREKETALIHSAKEHGLVNVSRRAMSSLPDGVSRQLVYARLKAGWTLKRARNTPPRTYSR